MIADLLAYAAGILVMLGAAFSLLAAIGILRLPDIYTRLHAASKAGVVGAGLILLAIALAAMSGPIAFRAVAGVVFLLLTTPVSAHLLARAAYLSGIRPSPSTMINEIPAETDNIH